MKWFAGLFVMLVTLAGCLAGAGAAPQLSADRISALTVSEALGGSGVTLEPPGLTAAARVDAQSAYAVCSDGRASCPSTSPTFARLALGTDAGPATLDASGRVNLVMNKRLVWAISWLNIECRFRGGAVVDEPASVPESSGPTRCDTVAFVDAGTGEFLYEVTYRHS